MELRLVQPGEPICAIHELSDNTSLKFRILEEGRPEEIFSAPREERTQQFLQRIVAAGRM